MMHVIERCQPWIEAALEYGNKTHTFQDVVEGIAEGRMQLWAAAEGCAVTEIVVYPRKKVLNIFLAGGKLDSLREMAPDMRRWAEAQGCASATLTGRRGWVRALAKDGWRELWTTLETEI